MPRPSNHFNLPGLHGIAAATMVIAASAAPVGAAQAAAVHRYAALAIAPDGSRVASIEDDDKRHGRIVVRDPMSRKPGVLATIDPCATCDYSGVTFGPDGSIAFLSRDRAAGVVQLQLASGASVRTIVTVRGLAQTPRFSRDGTRIALLVTPGAAKESGAVQAGVRQVGEIGEHNDTQQLAVFDVKGREVGADALTPLSPAGRYIYEYDWTPDGHALVVTSALGNGDANWWVATLDAVDARSGAVTNIARPTVQINYPRVSPDGSTIAFVGGLMSDFGSTGGDVWTVPIGGGVPVNRTQGATVTVRSISWTDAGLRGVVLNGAADRYEIVDIDPAAGGIGTMRFARAYNFNAGDGRVVFSADGAVMATVAQDFTHAPFILAGETGNPAKITTDNDSQKPMVTARSVHWMNEGYRVQGWLLAPRGADPKRRAPMISVVHGGPAAASEPSFVEGGTTADLIRAGYYIFMPNPRGSFGQGAAFTAANRRDFGGGDLRDILTGIDAVEQVAPVDGTRLGLTGGSYGGFMAMWANTQTNRFKAIIAGAGLSNWISYYGTNGIDQWMLPYFGKSLYDDYDAYRAPSAIYSIKSAKTPTFIYVGERDIEVPPTQSIEYWHALKDLGVPTSLVIYADEGHGIRRPDNAADLRKRIVAWFDRYLKSAD